MKKGLLIMGLMLMGMWASGQAVNTLPISPTTTAGTYVVGLQDDSSGYWTKAKLYSMGINNVLGVNGNTNKLSINFGLANPYSGFQYQSLQVGINAIYSGAPHFRNDTLPLIQGGDSLGIGFVLSVGATSGGHIPQLLMTGLQYSLNIYDSLYSIAGPNGNSTITDTMENFVSTGGNNIIITSAPNTNTFMSIADAGGKQMWVADTFGGIEMGMGFWDGSSRFATIDAGDGLNQSAQRITFNNLYYTGGGFTSLAATNTGTVTVTDTFQNISGKVALTFQVADTAAILRALIAGISSGNDTISAWTSASYASGWTTFAASPIGAEYTKDAEGRVWLRGGVSPTGTISTGASMFTLPLGYRPSEPVTLPVVAFIYGYGNSSSAVMVQVGTNGDVYLLFSGSTATFTSTSGVYIEGVMFITK